MSRLQEEESQQLHRARAAADSTRHTAASDDDTTVAERRGPDSLQFDQRRRSRRSRRSVNPARGLGCGPRHRRTSRRDFHVMIEDHRALVAERLESRHMTAIDASAHELPCVPQEMELSACAGRHARWRLQQCPADTHVDHVNLLAWPQQCQFAPSRLVGGKAWCPAALHACNYSRCHERLERSYRSTLTRPVAPSTRTHACVPSRPAR